MEHFRKKLITLLKRKYFFVQHHLVSANMTSTYTLPLNINLFLSTPDHFSCNIVFFMDTICFLCNTKIFAFNVWTVMSWRYIFTVMYEQNTITKSHWQQADLLCIGPRNKKAFNPFFSCLITSLMQESS